jgi:hypothetical protein
MGKVTQLRRMTSVAGIEKFPTVLLLVEEINV